jgi:serine/threonine protein kinase
MTFVSFNQAGKKPPRRRESQVSTTSVAKKGKNEDGAMINQYVIIKTLGKGSFATVLLCKDTHTHELFAIKKMNKKALKSKKAGKDKSAYDCVIEELKLLKRLEHPNIIWLHEIIDDQKKDHIYLVTEWLQKGTLGDLVTQKNK